MQITTSTETIDQYINRYPENVQEILQKIRTMLKDIYPEAGEKISYGIPTLTLNGKYFIYFAAFSHHVSVYPIPPMPESFHKKIAPYIKGKGTLQFQLSEPIPYDLIKEFSVYAKKSNDERTKKKK